MDRDQEIINTLYVAKILARRFSIAFGTDYQACYDIAEETIVKVYDKWDSQKSTFKTFAWRCVSRELKIYTLKKQRRKNVEIPLTFDDINEETTASNEDVQDAVQAKILLQQTIAYAALLNDIQKRIFNALLNGYRPSELGKVLEMPERTLYRHKAKMDCVLRQAVGY